MESWPWPEPSLLLHRLKTDMLWWYHMWRNDCNWFSPPSLWMEDKTCRGPPSPPWRSPPERGAMKNLVRETLQLEKMWLIERVNIDFTWHLCYSGDSTGTWSKKGGDVPLIQRRAAICEKVYSLWKNHLNGNIKLPASYFASFRIWYCHSLQ